MNKKVLIILLVLVGFIVINIFTIKDFYHAENNDFNKINSKIGVYNYANQLYNEEKYEDSIKEYFSILSDKKDNINFRINHNIGNNYYRIGEESGSGKIDKYRNDKKIGYWKKSVKYYKNALDIEKDEETEKNLKFVLNKIKEEEAKKENSKSDEQKKQENKDSSNKNDEKNSKSEKNQKGDQKDENSTKNSSKDSKENSKTDKQQKQENKDSSNKNDEKNSKSEKNQKGNEQEKGEGEKTKKSELSQGQKESLKQYEEALKQEQKKNSDSFNKVYREANNYNTIDDFFNNQFFDDLNGGGGDKKDW